ncbi:N-acetyltransferase [Marinibactrum halimedae]|uniref:N-acetyltransferase n=2 Tax=Marinibactrum halimedae TaxID=1444977 RepID=A0AA37T898_9GAMM|nr:N-acetyltransferase [Marinibactrum halimedae]
MSVQSIQTYTADYQNPRHGEIILGLLDSYARDPMGGGQGLLPEVCDSLIEKLGALSYAISIITEVDGQPAGLLNGFWGFSTFKAKPLLNIHDIVVEPEFRGLGVSQYLLRAAEAMASSHGCCKITLEVLDGNEVAKRAYQKFGFAQYKLADEAGGAEFWEKPL